MIAQLNYSSLASNTKSKLKKPAIQTARLPEQASNSIPQRHYPLFASETESACSVLFGKNTEQ